MLCAVWGAAAARAQYNAIAAEVRQPTDTYHGVLSMAAFALL